jgi:hypothetical protein
METIRIEIFDDGSSQVSVDGVKGKRCEQVTAELEKELGKKTSARKTAEFYEKDEKANVRASTTR